MKELLLTIIKSIKEEPERWMVDCEDIISYYTDGEQSEFVSIVLGKIFRRPYIYVNGIRIPFFRPFLRLRLKRAIRKLLINKGKQSFITK
jgi:hypothetical protein